MIRNLFGGATKCRTIDKLDIFGDGSCKALYRLDGNANDESGNYHGTETAITYGGGVYERGAVFNGTSSYINTGYTFPYTAFSYSLWYKYGSVNKMIISSISTNPVKAGQFSLTQDSATQLDLEFVNNDSGTQTILLNQTVPNMNDGLFHHIVIAIESGGFMKFYFDGSLINTSSAVPAFVNSNTTALNLMREPKNNYYKDGSLDQVRIFNRAITATEVATLHAECEPTSIVDNINPFEDGSLKALYKFDNDATDATGVHNGVATNVTYASGKFGNCAVFGGSSVNAKVTVPYIFPSGGNAISIWAKVDSANQSGGSLFGYATTVRQSLLRNDYNLLSAGAWMHRLPSGERVCTNLDEWYHIVYTSNGSEPLKLYVNGVLRTNLIVTNFNWTTFAIDGLGFYVASSTENLTGKLDQLRIFNKALTPLEVASLYNETTPMEEPMSVQVDPFKDGSGKALYRLEGNALSESGNYNLTALTNVVYESGRFGRGVRATSDTGTNLPTSYSTTNFTVSLWVKENVQASKYLFNFKSGNQTVYNQFYLTNNVNTNRVSVMVYNYLSNIQNTVTFGTNVYPTHGINFAGTPVAGKLSEWYMVTATYDGATLKAYENGVLIGSANIGSGWSLTAGVFSRLSQGTGESIDQIRVFNKALTQSEVTALYNEI